MRWVRFEAQNLDDIALDYNCSVPKGLLDHDIGQSREGMPNPYPARQTYRCWFTRGFDHCHRRFLWLNYAWGDAPLDPFDEKCQPGLAGLGQFELAARDDGFHACRQQLKHLCNLHGVSRVRRALVLKEGNEDSSHIGTVIRHKIHEIIPLIKLIVCTLCSAAATIAVVRIVNRTTHHHEPVSP